MFDNKVPIFALAFRPFFLLGAVYAAFAICYWAFYQLGMVGLPSYFEATTFHAHEMLFGFVAAILAGFLLTASRNWANTRGVHGNVLMFLVLVWFLGRASLLCSYYLAPEMTAIADLAFIPFFATLLYSTLSKGAKKMNFIFVLWLSVLFVANLLMHLDSLGITSGTARVGYLLAVDTIVVLMTIIGGRVIPMFTQNAIPGIQIIKRSWLEKWVIGSAVGLLVADLIEETAVVTAALSVVAGVAGLLRLSTWKSFRTARTPILWVLHLGYFFLAIGLVARGLMTSVFEMRSSIALHLVTAGAMGLLVLGMISRVALGHTGRPLTASRTMVIAYLLIVVGALIRVATPIVNASSYVVGIVAAAFVWAAGFICFVIAYWPVLLRPRIDGREG